MISPNDLASIRLDQEVRQEAEDGSEHGGIVNARARARNMNFEVKGDDAAAKSLQSVLGHG